jgi:hypothetical protein
MYYKLKAKSVKAYQHSIWDADVLGLDPDAKDNKSLTFEIGTGNIEKVVKLIKKHKLNILIEDEYAPNELSSIYKGVASV